jgi:hypothetical protein
MRILSASDAISPAVERTKRYLFRPFEWRTYLKLSAVACITEGFSLNFNYSSGQSSSPGNGSSLGFHPSNEVIALIVVAAIVGLIAGVLISYLITRLRFAFFHCVVYNTREIRLPWALYRVQAMRFFKACLVIWFSALVILSLAILPFILPFYRVFQSAQSGGQFDFMGFFMLFLPLFAIILVFCLVAYALEVVLHDFILPHMALEDASFREAWAAVRPRIGAEKGSFFFYFFLRALMPFLAMMGLMIVAAIPLLLVFGILALSVAGFNAALEDATGVLAVIRVALDVFFGIIGLGFGLVVAFSLGGPIATWVRNYALLFYGGRYTALGDILFPPPPPPPTLGTAEVA